MREIGPFAQTPTGDPYSLFWAVEGRGRKSVTLDLRTPEGQDVLRKLAATADVLVENFRPGTLEQWNIGRRTCPNGSSRCASRCSARTVRTRRDPDSTASASATAGCCNLTGYPDRPPVRVGVTISDYLTGVFAAQAAAAALYGREHARAIGRGHRRRALRVGPAHSRMDDRRRTTGWAWSAAVRATGSRTPRHSTTTRRPTASTSASSPVRTRTSPDCAAQWTASTCSTTRVSRKLADRAAHGDLINGVVAEWTRDAAAPKQSKRVCVANDVPVATAYTAADIFGDPHFALRGDLVNVVRPRDRCAFASKRRTRAASAKSRPRPTARPCSARTPTKSSSRSDCPPRRSRHCATRASCDAPIHDGLFEVGRRRHARADRRLLADQRAVPFSVARHVPVLGCDRRRTRCCSRRRDIVGVDGRDCARRRATKAPCRTASASWSWCRTAPRDHTTRARRSGAVVVRPADDARRR